MKNIKNSKELSSIIDKYLVPQELEKKINAEVSTPFILRNEMLDTMPTIFWTSPHTVFEPCAGKGGFIIDIIGRFMVGLKETIPDDRDRYKTILEECLYFSDINPTNIFICKLLIDPYGDYNLNYNEGDTLSINLLEKWGIVGFDAIIGNPPYQETDDNNKSKGGTNLYTKFINYAFSNLLSNGYLLFITPISWLGPSTNKQMGGDILHNIFFAYDLLYLNLNECKKHFNVGSTFSYYLVQKSKTVGILTDIKSEYNKTVVISTIDFKQLSHFKFLPVHITAETIELVNEIISKPNKFNIQRCRQLDSSAKETKKHLRLTQTEAFNYITYHTTSKTYYSDIKLDSFESFKVLLNMAGYLKPVLVSNCNMTESKFFITVSCELESVRIINMLSSVKVVEYLKLCKYSGFNSRPVLESISFDII